MTHANPVPCQPDRGLPKNAPPGPARETEGTRKESYADQTGLEEGQAPLSPQDKGTSVRLQGHLEVHFITLFFLVLASKPQLHARQALSH